MSSPSGSAQINSILVLTLPLVIWHMGPSKISWQECLNLRNSSKRLSGCFHFGGTGGVILVRLNELYSLTICTLAGFGFTGGLIVGDTGDTCPPTAPSCPSTAWIGWQTVSLEHLSYHHLPFAISDSGHFLLDHNLGLETLEE